ncbi:HPP family protein, partial [Linderina pennispora]
PPPPVLTWSVFSGVTSFLGMATIAMIQKYGAAIKNHDLPFAIAPFGATAVLVFGVPAAPLAQPRNVLVGHVLSALVGIFVHEIFKHVDDSLMWLPGALAVGIAIGLMGLVNCYHPPAGATAFLAGMASPEVKRVGWWYPLYPVLPVALIMVAVSVILNNLCRVFPVYWLTPAKMPAEEPASASG